MKAIFKKSMYLLLLIIGIGSFASCSLVNPNSKIVGKYELRLEDSSKKKKSSDNKLSSFIGKSILNKVLKSDVEFRSDGTADFKVDLFGMNLGDDNSDFLFEVKNPNTLIVKSEEETVSFKMTKIEQGFKLENEDITFYLKEKEE